MQDNASSQQGWSGKKLFPKGRQRAGSEVSTASRRCPTSARVAGVMGAVVRQATRMCARSGGWVSGVARRESGRARA
ncbi:hypothetical protein GCM10009801_26170 [Streptomyces albiaxialis]|uniref:Uncharacterized protein n=1 Tax=Streptomyces albiaxialis TaxID=329523 RepID=A0ABP5HDM1_9ACTN